MMNIFFAIVKHIFFVTTLFFLLVTASAQINITYPTQAQNLTRGLTPGTLTVTVGFSGACASSNVTISLPTSVTYVAGSVVKTTGSGSAITIAENDISNLNAPVFSFGGITF